MIGWTQGFFPGENWLLYDQSRTSDWRSRAEAWTRPLEVQQCNMQTHDLGFKFMPSYGLAYQLTGDAYYKQVLLTAAGALASRYNPRVDIISCCDWNPDWHLPMVADPSHGTGLRDKVIPMGRAAIAAGADGLLVEMHPNPDRAMSDGGQSLFPEQFARLVRETRAIAEAIGRSLAPPPGTGPSPRG